MKTGLFWLCTVVLTVGALAADPPLSNDDDSDGISDEHEQVLLEKFRPTLLVSLNDCDSVPAEFLSGSEKPRAIARNGTIYGQVFPRRMNPEQGALIEIHYYHLWARDCGRTGHPLDAEYVAVLVRGEHSQPATAWKAVYWYAAAHEDTVCDRSAAAKASVIGGDDRGIAVWVSRGKHASFLSLDGCEKGCGHDRCGEAIALSVVAIVNLGELGAPLNGAVWIRSPDWPLSQKMQTAFSDELLAQLAGSEGEIQVGASGRHLQPVVSGGGVSLDALARTNDQTSAALSAAGTSTNRALDIGARNVGRSLKQATSAIRQSLRFPRPNPSR